jgi:hypothetical protein
MNENTTDLVRESHCKQTPLQVQNKIYNSKQRGKNGEILKLLVYTSSVSNFQ